MSQLIQGRCVACQAGSPPVTDQEMNELMPQIPNWELFVEDGIRKLRRVFLFDRYTNGLAFSIDVGNLAEDEGHHPRITIEYKKVTIDWWTHKIRDLHKNDLIMAAKTDVIHGRMHDLHGN